MTDSFYAEFESNFRGTRELIMERLRVYDDFLQPLLALSLNVATVDLGCGRGEWIEKMQSMGFAPHGVDLDAGMLQSCRDMGFQVHHGDALDYLAALPDNSQAVVSAFHLVEHLQFEQIQKLIAEALRVLTPAGLLIMETPNPENLIVATRNFYLDPTHQKPVPPELLTFLPKLIGCDRIKLVRLQESAQLRFNTMPTLADVIGGASPDYAVIVQKSADINVLKNWNTAFSKDYGLSLYTLLERYDHNNSLQLQTLRAKLNSLEIQVLKALELAEKAELKSHSAHVSSLETMAQTQAEIYAQLKLIYMSRSWRITAPLRWLSFQIKLLREHGPMKRFIALMQKLYRLAFNPKIYSNSNRIEREGISPKLSPRGLEIREDLQKALTGKEAP
jgi:O-antigen chain-terminating methyltransferase